MRKKKKRKGGGCARARPATAGRAERGSLLILATVRLGRESSVIFG